MATLPSNSSQQVVDSTKGQSAIGSAVLLITRLALYTAMVGLGLQATVLAAQSGWSGGIAAEDGLLEVAQTVLALASSVLFLSASAKSRSAGSAFAFVGFVCLFAFVRELDRATDELLWHGAWKWLAAPWVAAALYVVWRVRSRLRSELVAFVETPVFYLVFFGFLVVLVYAQVIGQKQLWQAVMGDGYQRIVKDTVEEVSETLGYAVVWFAALEAALHARVRG